MILILREINTGLEIENPVVRVENNEIVSVKSCFIHVDTLRADENYNLGINTVMDELMTVQVKPGEDMNILVKSNPKYFMVVQRQSDGNYEEIAEISREHEKKCTINAPREAGKYIYSISVDYKAGLGIYYFEIEVVNE